jgi:galactokinase
MREIEVRAAAAYRAHFQAEPEVVTSAPGRVNLIGEHTDYSGGFVLPCAVDPRVAVAAGTGTGDLYSADQGEARPTAREQDISWADYPRGVAWALGQSRGEDVPPFHAAFAGEVPQGAGLSSSAAIEAATGLALNALFGLDMPRPTLALLCQRAENDFVGVPCGIMDQYASLLCQAGNALLLDCRSLDAEQVPLDLDAAGLALLVCDTRVKRELGDVPYRERREACERAARALGVALLRDARAADLERLSGVEQRRARHVITENARVLAAVEALRACDFAAFGELMYASHASLRDDFAVSTPELDTFVEVARSAGALGARLTGAGFGGCAIALLPEQDRAALEAAVSERFARERFVEPRCYAYHPSVGAEVAR